MKKALVLLTVFIMLVCSLGMVGCKDSVKVDSFNSYVVSVYEEVYKQDDYGKVTFQGLKLKKSFQVPKTQMFELDIELYEKEEEIYFGKYYYEIEGEYDRERTYGEHLDVTNQKLTIFPQSDLIITMRKRELKNINLYYKGMGIENFMSKYDMVDEYYDYFLNTYEEKFYIPNVYVKEVLKDVKRSVIVELYNTPEFYGEPIYETEFEYVDNTLITTGIELHLLKSTDIYFRVIAKV